jgi:uncharacterized protein YndB with AHSA1/START domain
VSPLPAASADGTFERTADGGVIRFERHLRYPVREVWDAITNPVRLAEWWLPHDADITIDLRTGGEMTIRSQGDEPPITCTIRHVEPPLLFEHTHIDGTSHLRWELESVDSGCVLRVSNFVTDTASAIAKSYVAGLHVSLGRLAAYLAGQPVAWDWDAFAETQAHYARQSDHEERP